MPTLTIFANFYINSDERYLRMVDSFNSFKDISAEKWVVNARGIHAKKTISFLQEHLGEKLISFSLESKQGWFHDTKQMLSSINSDFVLFWLEDHINTVDPKIYSELIHDMKKDDSDYLEYSWWHSGEILIHYQSLPKIENEISATFTLTKKDLFEIEKNYSIFIISMAGVFSLALFKKIILETKLFLRQYPKQTPFNFEKGGGCKNWLPITITLPKQELFANIDDDHSDPGYSLQSRGLYSIREKREPTMQRAQKNQTIQKIKALIPDFIYKPLIRMIILFNSFKKYLNLVRQGK